MLNIIINIILSCFKSPQKKKKKTEDKIFQNKIREIKKEKKNTQELVKTKIH